MLQPQSYPGMIAQALVLEDEPFVRMADDDNPWVEGLVFTLTIGVVGGAASALGSLLTAASLPDPNAVEAVLLQGWRQFAAAANLPGAALDGIIQQAWRAATVASGYAGGWSHAGLLISTPFALVVWWLLFGLIAFGAARAAGGHGGLSSTLGATALMAAPNILLLLTIMPFAAISGALLSMWGLLIGYRAIKVVHRLPWQKAVAVTIIPYVAAIVVLAFMAGVFALGFTAGGYR